LGRPERVGMQAAAINLDAQQFLKPNVGEIRTSRPKWSISANWLGLFGASKVTRSRPNLAAKRSAKERLRAPSSSKSPTPRADFSGLDDDLLGPSIEPALALGDELG